MVKSIPKAIKALILGNPSGKISENTIKTILHLNCHFLLNELDFSRIRRIRSKDLLNYLLMLKLNGTLYKRELRHLDDILRKAKVKYVLLKGAKDFFLKDEGYAYYFDIDLLFKNEEVYPAYSKLLSEGYQWCKDFFSNNYLEAYGFHYVLSKPGFKYPVEIHWGLMDGSNPFVFEEGLIWKEYVNKIEGNLYFLKPEFEAIYLIAACFFKDFGSTFLITAFRINKLVKGGMKWNRFCELALRHKCAEMVLQFSRAQKLVLGQPLLDLKYSKMLECQADHYKNFITSFFFKGPFYIRRMNTFSHWLFLVLYNFSFTNLFYMIRKGLYYQTLLIKRRAKVDQFNTLS